MSDMPLSGFARDLAAEINYHDWSDAPYRADRAGHQRHHDGRRAAAHEPLERHETDAVRMNVMWVVAQVLGRHDPNFDVFRFAEACGVDTRTPSGRPRSGGITAGLRIDSAGRHAGPVLSLFCHACDRAILGRQAGESQDADHFRPTRVYRAGVVLSDRPGWAWGPVPVHQQCLGALVTPYSSSPAPHRHTVPAELVDYAVALRDQQLQGLHTAS